MWVCVRGYLCSVKKSPEEQKTEREVGLQYVSAFISMDSNLLRERVRVYVRACVFKSE